MFRVLANLLHPNALVQLHPADLAWWTDLVWDVRQRQGPLPLGPAAPPLPPTPPLGPHPNTVPLLSLEGLELNWFSPPWEGRNITLVGGVVRPFKSLAPVRNPLAWPHLIYAYLIESTHIVEIYRAVLQETIHGEKFGSPTEHAKWWLRCTEELFFRFPTGQYITGLRSDLRPHSSSIRRNAYYRMFGMGLPHSAGDGAKDFVKPPKANTEFVPIFEEFLREVWIGIENQGNTSGANPTDPGKVGDLAERLHDMLLARRTNGNLSREEYNAVVMADWFHLSVTSGIAWITGNNSPIVDFLRAEATSQEERLSKVADRAGVPMHARAKSFFDVADLISLLLLEIESGIYNQAPQPLFVPGPIEQRMRVIIRHWALLTGRDPKAKKRTPTPAPVMSGPQTNGASTRAGYVTSSLD